MRSGLSRKSFKQSSSSSRKFRLLAMFLMRFFVLGQFCYGVYVVFGKGVGIQVVMHIGAAEASLLAQAGLSVG